MIVLKALAREFGLDPYKLRQHLRATRGEAKNRRWKWEDNDPELASIRKSLKKTSLLTTKLAADTPPSNARPKPTSKSAA